MAGTLRTIEFQVGLYPLEMDNSQIPFAMIEEIAFARVAKAQFVKQRGTELMQKIYVLRQAGIKSPEDVAATLDITLHGAQSWIGRLEQLLTKINDDGN